MKRFSDEFLALQVLDNRNNGYSARRYFDRAWKTYLWSGLVFVAVLLLLWFPPVPRGFYFFALGLILGGWLRDFGWVRATVRSWPFLQKVIDWDKVNSIAKKSVAQRAAQPDAATGAK